MDKVNIEPHLKKWFNYQQDTGIRITFEDFMLPKVLEDIHSKNVGTVLKKYDKNYETRSHFTHFGKMFFYEYIFIKELQQNEI